MRKRVGRSLLIMTILSAILAHTLACVARETQEWNPEAERVIVTRVIDGDTVVVLSDSEEFIVRMIGVDTPETVHPRKAVQAYGKEASEFTRQAIEGKPVWLEFDVSRVDRYGRVLAYIWTHAPSSRSDLEIREYMYKAVILLNGYGQVMTIPPNVRYADAFVRHQSEAMERECGLWMIDQEPNEQSQCVDLNTASAQELQRIIHIGPERAKMIIQGRPWHSVEELIEIDGLGEARLLDIIVQGLASVECQTSPTDPNSQSCAVVNVE